MSIQITNGVAVETVSAVSTPITNAELLLRQRITNKRVIDLTQALSDKTAEKTAIDSAVEALGLNS